MPGQLPLIPALDKCTIHIIVYGAPAPQGSKKFVGHSKAGHAVLVESSKAVRPWREAVKAAALAATGGAAVRRIAGPVTCRMVFTVAKPKSAPKRRRTWPDRYPDLSKLVRATEDALSDVGIWEDDARVVECTAAKRYPDEGEGSLPVPGAWICISAIAESAEASA